MKFLHWLGFHDNTKLLSSRMFLRKTVTNRALRMLDEYESDPSKGTHADIFNQSLFNGIDPEYLKALEWLETHRPALKLGQRHNIARMIAEYVENRGLKAVV